MDMYFSMSVTCPFLCSIIILASITVRQSVIFCGVDDLSEKKEKEMERDGSAQCTCCHNDTEIADHARYLVTAY